MKKALIIGGAGFVGKYLAAYLDELGYNICITKLSQESVNLPYVTVFDLNLLCPEEIDTVLKTTAPDYIFHLAAQSSVALSWAKPALTVDINIKGAVNLLEAVRKIEPKPRILLIGSSEEYGHIKSSENPVTEETPTQPGNIYAVTKICQEMLGRLYIKAYGLDIMTTRSFNHIGPGQAPGFVVADFCKQVAEIEKGKKTPIMRVGTLTARRDFTDVRDVVRAYVLLMEKGQTGEIYNVGSGNAVAVQDLLDMILSFSMEKITVEVDPNKFRPSDTPIIQAEISKLVRDTGWQPAIPLAETIKETLDYWRKAI